MLNESIKMNKWVDPTDADAMRMRLIQKLKNEDKQKEREKPRLSIRTDYYIIFFIWVS